MPQQPLIPEQQQPLTPEQIIQERITRLDRRLRGIKPII